MSRVGKMGTTIRAVSLLGLLLLAGCKTELYSGLEEQEANDMIAVLQSQGISSDKLRAKDGTESVQVDQGKFADAVNLLRERGFPRKKYDTIGDVFKQSGLVASPMQDRARFLYALGQELSSTVSQIDGVITARVEVVLPDNDIMQRNPTPSSASVFVRYDVRSHVDQLVPQIKMLVANSVQGLSYDKVSVVLVPVTRSTEDAPPANADQGASVLSIVLSVLSVLLLAGAGAGFFFRNKLAELLGRRGGFPTIWTGTAE